MEIGSCVDVSCTYGQWYDNSYLPSRLRRISLAEIDAWLFTVRRFCSLHMKDLEERYCSVFSTRRLFYVIFHKAILKTSWMDSDEYRY